MQSALGGAYTSASQQARVITESWAEQNLYCPACPSDSIHRLAANTKSLDFKCSRCDSTFQLKSASRKFGACINDGAYSAMRATIVSGRTPGLFMLHYQLPDWTISNLTLVPSFAFPLSCLQPRTALSATARRAGWIGCNILLTRIPPDTRIPMVADGIAESLVNVRRQFDLLRPISKLNALQRGWTLDVLTVIRAMNQETFTLSEILKHRSELQRMHPENQHVEAKIRQQLQRLRDLGILEFLDNKGKYRLRTPPTG